MPSFISSRRHFSQLTCARGAMESFDHDRHFLGTQKKERGCRNICTGGGECRKRESLFSEPFGVEGFSGFDSVGR